MRRMMLGVFVFTLVVAAMLLAGCVPERVVWSPDGTRAAVLGSDGLHLCDANGALSPLLVPEAKVVAWLPDGKHVVLAHSGTLKTWGEVNRIFGSGVHTDTNQVRKSLIAYSGEAGKVVEELAVSLKISAEEVAATLMELRDTEESTLKPQLGDRWAALSKVEYPVELTQVYEVGEQEAKAGPPLFYLENDTHQFVGLRVSPTGKYVAIAVAEKHDMSKDEGVALFLEATDGSTEDAVRIGPSSWFADWSADGRNLVYIKPLGKLGKKEEAQLGMLVRQEVVDEKGKLWEANKLPEEEHLAGLLYQSESRVRVLKDGRIFFVAADVTLPTTPADVDVHPTLFSIQPGKQATVTRVIPKSAEADVGNLPQFFEVSPDMTHAVIPFEDGRISVLDLGTGKVDVVQDQSMKKGDQGWGLESAPVWRSADEVTFLRPAKDGNGREVVVYSLSTRSATVLSAGWSKEVKEQWLEQNGPTSQPGP